MGETSEVELPEEIADIVTALAVDVLEVTYNGRYIYLHPTHEISGQVFAISDSGVSYKLIVTTDADTVDTSVRITATGTQTRQRLLATRTLTAVNLIRAMVRKERLPGVEYAEAEPEEVYNDGTLSLRILEAYWTPTMRGYVLQVENLTRVSVPVPIQNIEMPGLLAIGARAQLLYPTPQTLEEELAAAHQSVVYLVVK